MSKRLKRCETRRLGLVPAARSCSEWPTDKNTSIKWKKKEKKDEKMRRMKKHT
jgi:hypothetical protein